MKKNTSLKTSLMFHKTSLTIRKTSPTFRDLFAESIKRLMLILFVLLSITNIAHAKLSLQLDPPKAALGDTIRLILTTDNTQSHQVPDLSELQTNFKIIGTEQSTSYSFVNGQGQSTAQWTILLMPKKIGLLPIPALQVGQEATQPTSIEITAEAATNSTDTQNTEELKDIFLKTNLSIDKPYINQQVIYTVKLYHRGQLMNASYEPPQIDNALMIPLGQAKQYDATVKQQAYTVEEQQYAIFPQQSGLLTLIPPRFKALIYDYVPRQVSAHGKGMQLEVLSAPLSGTRMNDPWLPAKQLTLQENYQSNDKLKVGDTITRTIELKALGVPVELLPTISFASSDDVSAYPEKPVTENHIQADGVMGTAKYQVTYVIHSSGEVRIPAVVVRWFDTTKGKVEKIALSARVLQVAGVPLKVNKVSKKETTVAGPSLFHHKLSEKVPSHSLTSISSWSWWMWIAGLFALLWLVTMYVSWIRPRWRFKSSKKSLREDMGSLRDACLSGDPLLAKKGIIQWARNQWPERKIFALNDVINLVKDEKVQSELLSLEHILYQKDKQHEKWQGDLVWVFIKSSSRKEWSKKIKINSILPMINP